jgi:tetratricopeptide (TPR) repeat protein
MRTAHAISLVFPVMLVALLLGGCSSAQSRKQAHFEQGERFLSERNYTKASLEFRNALQIDPNFLRARLDLGRTAEELGDVRAALGQYQAVIDADHDNVEARVLTARVYLLARLPDKALETLAPALIRNPEDSRLLTVRGAVRAQQGNAVGALADAEAAYKRAPDDEFTVALLASVLKQSGKIDEAIALIRGALVKRPSSVDLHIVMADLLATRQDFAGAEGELKQLVALEPTVLSHRYQLAAYYSSRGDLDAAERTLNAAVDSAPQSDEPKLALVQFDLRQRGEAAAQARLTRFFHDDPKDYDLELQLAASLLRTRVLDKAEALYLDVIKRADENRQGLIARDMLAMMRLNTGRVAEAQKLVNDVLKMSPRDSQALFLRANMELESGDATAAITDLRAELRDEPTSPVVLRTLAGALTRNGQPALAQETLRTSLQANPKDIPTRLDLAQSLAGAGDSDQAKNLLAAVIADAPNNMTALEAMFRLQTARKEYAEARGTASAVARAMPSQGLGNYLLGTVDQVDGKTDTAVRDYENALTLQPDAIEPLTALTDLELSRHEGDRAMEKLNWAIQKVPKNYAAFNLKGQILTIQGKYKDAIQAFQAAITIKPQWWVLYQNLSRAQTKSGDVSAAADTLALGLQRTGYDATLAAELTGLYELLGKPAQAIDVCEHSLQQNPHSTAAVSNLAMLLVTYRSDPVSMSRAQNLARPLEQSTNPDFQDTAGWVRFKSGDYRSALTLLQSAAHNAPDSELVRYHLGMAQLRTGDDAAGRSNVQRAVASGRPFLGIAEAKSVVADFKPDRGPT